MTGDVEAPLGQGRVLVVGAGALGSVYGGLLSAAGMDVQLLGRAPHVAAIRTSGLVVHTPSGAQVHHVRATSHPGEVEPAEVVIVLVKTPDTSSVLDQLAHLRGTPRLAVSLQNGLEEAGLLVDWAGRGAVVGGASMVGATLEAPGVVRHTLEGPTFLGEHDGTISARVEALGDALGAAGLEAVVTGDIRSVEWSKLVHAAPSMSLTALTRRWFHEVLVAPELAELFVDQLFEGVAIARAAGVEVKDWPQLLPLATIASGTRAEARDLVRAHGERLEEAGMTEIRISMLQSIERGRRTEVDATLGVLVRAAAAHDVDAPVLRTCHGLLAGIDRHLS